MSMLQKVGLAGTAVVASAVMGAGIGLATSSDDADLTPAKRSDEAAPTAGENPAGAILENTPEWQDFVEKNPEFASYAETLRSGREGLFSPTGELGWVDADVALSTVKANGPEDLAPVTNEAGERIAWFAPGYGWVEDEDLADKGFEAAVTDAGPKIMQCDDNGENCDVKPAE